MQITSCYYNYNDRLHQWVLQWNSSMAGGSQKIRLKKLGLVSHDMVVARTESLQLSECIFSKCFSKLSLWSQWRGVNSCINRLVEVVISVHGYTCKLSRLRANNGMNNGMNNARLRHCDQCGLCLTTIQCLISSTYTHQSNERCLSAAIHVV